MGAESRDEFDDLKLVLGRYARSRAGKPWARVDAEFGEIMLRLLKFADQLDVDLIDSGMRALGRAQRPAPRLVRSRRPPVRRG